MVLKRKRSDSDMSSASSLLSSPLSSNLLLDQFQPYSFQVSRPSLFASRTRKRHRDNRPSEAEVHQHTLSLLFSAQQNPQLESHPPSAFPTQDPISSLPSSSQPKPQSSLHAFWSIPSSRQSSPSSNSSISSYNSALSSSLNNIFEATNCEDCNASFNTSGDSDAMDVDMMMDIDMDGRSHACTSCGKHVCHSCAVSNLGAERKCLNCAGRKQVWDEGLGMGQE